MVFPPQLQIIMEELIQLLRERSIQFAMSRTDMLQGSMNVHEKTIQFSIQVLQNTISYNFSYGQSSVRISKPKQDIRFGFVSIRQALPGLLLEEKIPVSDQQISSQVGVCKTPRVIYVQGYPGHEVPNPQLRTSITPVQLPFRSDLEKIEESALRKAQMDMDYDQNVLDRLELLKWA